MTVKSDGEDDQHHDAGSGMVGMENGQAHQQQRHHGHQHPERMPAPQHEGNGGHQGESGRERCQLLHLMGGDRIDEQRGERDERQHHIEIRPAQQLPQRGDSNP